MPAPGVSHMNFVCSLPSLPAHLALAITSLPSLRTLLAMSSFPRLPLLLLVLALVLVLLPPTSADISLITYTDSACTKKRGDELGTDDASSPACQDTWYGTSKIVQCDVSSSTDADADAAATFTFKWANWNVEGCPKTARYTFESTGTVGACSSVKRTESDGSTTSVYGMVDCGKKKTSAALQRLSNITRA